MKTLQMTVSTKKGETQVLRFLVVQEIPYPDITAERGEICWRNFGGLFRAYGCQKAEGIGEHYICNLLSDTAPEVIPSDYSRTMFAGYESAEDRTKLNGGTFKFRGKDLGEMQIRFNSNPDYPEVRVNGFNAPSIREAAIIQELICPALLKFIAQNRAELKAAAVASIKAKFEMELRKSRETLNKLEQQAGTATY